MVGFRVDRLFRNTEAVFVLYTENTVSRDFEMVWR